MTFSDAEPALIALTLITFAALALRFFTNAAPRAERAASRNQLHRKRRD